MSNTNRNGKPGGQEKESLVVCERALSTSERRLRSMLELGQLIGLDLQLDEMLVQIASKAKTVMDADRFTILLYDPKTDELWTKMPLEVEGKVLRTPSKVGISGHCFHTGETVNVEDAYNDPRFFRYIDDMTGYRTKSMLSMPFFSRSGPPMGVIQIINKHDGNFTGEDEELLRTFSNHAAVFIEIAQLQKARMDTLEESRKELERLNRAKGKALDHLSHELKTPLALIQGYLRILERKAENKLNDRSLEKYFPVLKHYLKRLFDIQKESEKIIRTYREIENENIVDELERLWNKLETSGGELPANTMELRQALEEWIACYIPAGIGSPGPVDLDAAAERAVSEARASAPQRDIEFRISGEKGLTVLMDSGIIQDMVAGLLKNAIENTPDGGSIEISLERKDRGIDIAVRDSGVGITEENRENIFEGLFHTQDTDLYGSKKAYDFGAGGKGLDLLQMKIYGRRFGFSVSMESTRCVYIPTDRDLCPGRISECPHIRGREDCLASGGSTFHLTFPVAPEYLKTGRNNHPGTPKGSVHGP